MEDRYHLAELRTPCIRSSDTTSVKLIRDMGTINSYQMRTGENTEMFLSSNTFINNGITLFVCL